MRPNVLKIVENLELLPLHRLVASRQHEPPVHGNCIMQNGNIFYIAQQSFPSISVENTKLACTGMRINMSVFKWLGEPTS